MVLAQHVSGLPVFDFCAVTGVLSTWWFSVSGIDALGRDDWRMTHLVLTKCVLLKAPFIIIWYHLYWLHRPFIFFCPIDKKIYDIFKCSLVFFQKSIILCTPYFSPFQSLMIHGASWSFRSQKFAPQAAFISRLGELARSACVVLTVCTGSLLLAATKLLDGLKATTNKVRQEGMVEA